MGVVKTPFPLAHLQLNHFTMGLHTCVSLLIACSTFQLPVDKCSCPQNCPFSPQNCPFPNKAALCSHLAHEISPPPVVHLCISCPSALQFLRLEVPPALQMFGFIFHIKLIFYIYIKYGFIFHFAPHSPCLPLLLPLRAAGRFSAGDTIPTPFQRGKN